MLVARTSLLLAFLCLAACGGGEGPPEPVPEDPHKALLPAQCRIEPGSAECEACIASCCWPCNPGSECIRFRACFQSCAGNFACLEDCSKSHPDGERAWLEADLCVERECAELC